MGEIVFAEPRHHYQSYEDLRSLIRLSGFASCFIDEIDPDSDNTYVITILNSELPDGGYPNARAKLVLWNLEYHLDGLPPLANVEVWAADKWYAQQIGAKYVPMGSHYNLRVTQHSMNTERYDAAYLGYMIPRREQVAHEMRTRGVRLSPPHAWGDERDRILISSTAYVHVHQHEHIPTVPPLRMVVAAAYQLPVITETCADYGIFSHCMLPLDYADIAENVAAWTRGEVKAFERGLDRCGATLHQLLCYDLTFRKSVEAAL